MADFNLFLVLDLDPAAPWNQALFDSRLRERQAFWSSQTTHPNQKKQNEARRHIQLIPQMLAVAADEQLRAQHAAEARNASAARRKALQQELDRDLKYQQVKGYLTPKELAELEKRYAAVISPADLKKRLHVPVQQKPVSEAEPGPAVLDPSTMRKIQDDLDQLGRSDLYDFLNMDRNSARGLLLAEADRLYKASQANVNKTVEVEAQSRLAGAGQAHFKTDEAQARYDASLDDARFNGMRSAADKMAGETKLLTPAAVQMLMDEFLGAGGERALQRGLAVLRAHAAKKGWVMEPPAGLNKARTCGNGHVVIGATAEERCRECGVPLFEDCPRCPERKIPSDQRACPSCEFPLGNRGHVRKECEKADALCRQKRFKDAAAHVSEAAAAWPQATRGELQHRIEALQTQISAGLTEQQTYLDELQQALKQRRFYLARDHLLHEAARAFPPQAPELAADRAAAESGISRAQAALERARKLADAAARSDAYMDVLDIAVDCKEALDALEATPPEAPASLQASVAGREVQLHWQARPARLTSYILSRRASSPQAAATVIPVEGLSYQDASPEAGVALYYSVHAVRGNARSAKGADLKDPVYVLEEAGDLKLQPGDREVTLAWQRPAGTIRVLVRRGQGEAPHTATEGVNVPVGSDGCSAIDRGLENGQSYGYAVFTQLSLPGGRGMVSPGLRRTATPVEPPEPILELSFNKVAGAGERMQVVWTPPARGEGRLFARQEPFQLRAGEQRTLEELVQRFGEPLSGGPGSAEERLPAQGVRYYLPVTVVHGSATIGQEHAYRNVEECSQLESDVRGDRLRLKWKWPPGCSHVLIGVSPLGFVTEKEARSLSLAQYGGRDHGHYDIANSGLEDQHVVIFALHRGPDGTLVPSGGYRKRVLVRNRLMLRYEILKHWIWGTLKLRVDVVKGEGSFPALVLVRSERRVPTRRSDGVRILEVPRDTPREERELRIPDEIRGESAFGKLFLADDQDLERVTLQHPPDESLRLY
jgi:hypothetical protein